VHPTLSNQSIEASGIDSNLLQATFRCAGASHSCQLLWWGEEEGRTGGKVDGTERIGFEKNLQESPHHGFGPSQAVDVRQLTGWDLSGLAHLIPLDKGEKQQHDFCKKKQTIDCDEVESRRFRELSWLVGLDELEDES